jgi:sugar phosphate isomerase/epimerase
MRISISSGTLFTFPLHKAFHLAREAGFDGVELIINQDFQRVNNRKLLDELTGIMPILSIHAPFMPLDGWGNQIDSLKRSVDLALHCGATLVNFHPPSWLGFEIRFWRWLYKIVDFQKEIGQGGVQITIENMPWVGTLKINPHIFSSTQLMIDFIEERNLYLTFDCTHMGSGRTNFINDFYLFYHTGRIKNVHFSDYGQGREHLLPGHGILPLSRFLHHLKTTGYGDTLTLELSPHEFPRDEVIIVDALREVQEYLRRETNGTPTVQHLGAIPTL